MGAGDELLDDSSMDLDVGPIPLKPSRFQPKIKGKVKAEPSPSPSPAPTPAASAAESIYHSDKTEPSMDPPVSYCNAVIVAAIDAENSSMEVEEEDVVVQEFDVYLNTSLDADTKLYDMQYPLRPSWRPYQMNESCNEVKIKPKLSQFEIQFSVNFDSDESYDSYDKQVDDNLMITTQTLVSSTKNFVNQFAVGFLIGDRFYVNPLHAIVQFRPSQAHADGVQVESSLKFAENSKESVKMANIKGKAVQDAAKEANEQIDEPWVLLQYHASDTPASRVYREKALTEVRNYIPLAMKPSDYLYSFGGATYDRTRKTISNSKRYLLSRPLEERLKQWLSEGSQVNRFIALLHLAPNDSVEDVLRLLQLHAYLVQGLWVTKSSLLHDGPAALYRDYILLQFSKNRTVHESKLKVVKLEDLRKSLLKPLAVERTVFKDWKFKEDTDSSFIKQYPEIVKEQEHAWSIREKEILESLPGIARSIPPLFKNFVNSGASSRAVGELGRHRDGNDAGTSAAATMPSKGQEALAKAILELLRLYKVLSLNSIIQGLKGKENAGATEVESVADQIAIKVYDVYVLKSLGKPAIDQFRNVVIEYFIGKGRNAKVKKQEIKLAAQYRLKRDVSDVDYSQVMNELCMSSGGSWTLKSGAFR